MRTFFDEAHELAMGIAGEASGLRYFAYAFRETGNEHAAARLEGFAKRLDGMSDRLDHLLDDKLRGDFVASTIASTNVIRAACAGIAVGRGDEYPIPDIVGDALGIRNVVPDPIGIMPD